MKSQLPRVTGPLKHLNQANHQADSDRTKPVESLMHMTSRQLQLVEEQLSHEQAESERRLKRMRRQLQVEAQKLFNQARRDCSRERNY